MRNKSFKFKQFAVYHDKCAMKVGTDGVLLGAWSGVDNAINVLDVGTGTALISLMLAQRNRSVSITAIEIDKQATEQAIENVENSIFSDNINVIHTSFQDFAENHTDEKYDLIVSNPPFFVNSLQSPNNSRSYARHADSLTLKELLSLSSKVISTQGRLCFIYPYNEIADIKSVIMNEGWCIERQTNVYTKPESTLPKRQMYQLVMNSNINNAISENLIIEVERHQYSEEYIALTKDFYLRM